MNKTVILSAILPTGFRVVFVLCLLDCNGHVINSHNQSDIIAALNNNFGNNKKISASFYENGLLIAAKLYKRQAEQTWQDAVYERDKRP